MNHNWNQIDCEWIHLVSLGDYKFGEDIDQYVQMGLAKYDFDDEPDNTGWETYSTHDPSVLIYTEVSIIITVDCDNRFVFKEHNLIGLSIPELINPAR